MDLKSERDLGEKAAHILYPLFVGQFFGIIFTALTFIVVAMILHPTNYGLYVFAFGFSTLVNGFAGFGVGAYFSNILAKYSYQRDGEGILRALWSGYIIAAAVGLFLTLFGIAISGFIASAYPGIGIDPTFLKLAAATIVFMLINTISVSALIGFSRSGLGAMTNVIVDVVQLGLSIVLTLKFGVAGAIGAMLIGYMLGAIIGSIFVFIAASKYVRFRLAIPPGSHIWKIFLYVTPIAWTNFLNTGMENFTILFLGFFVTTAALGNYGAAVRGLALITMIYSAISSGLFPIFTTAKAIDTDGNVNATYNKIIRFAVMLMLPVVIFVGVMSIPGLYLTVGSLFATAPQYLTLIAAGTAVALFSGYINNLLISEGHTGKILKVNAISALIQFVLLLIIVPRFYILGAIVTVYILGPIIEAFMFTGEATKLFGIKFEYFKLLRIYISGAVFAFVLAALVSFIGHFLSPYGLTVMYILEIVIGLILTLLIYPLVLVVLRAITWHDIKSMRHATMRLGRMSFAFAAFFSYSEYLYRILIGMQ